MIYHYGHSCILDERLDGLDAFGWFGICKTIVTACTVASIIQTFPSFLSYCQVYEESPFSYCCRIKLIEIKFCSYILSHLLKKQKKVCYME